MSGPATPGINDDLIDVIEPTTIDEAQLQMVRALHDAVHGNVWARPESPADVWRELLDVVKRWRRPMPVTPTATVEQIDELYCPSTDVCAWCGDSECDGISCVTRLDPEDERDYEAFTRLHAWLRRGQLAEQVERRLAEAENRSWPPR